jgi:hypothetical protein
VPVTPGPTAFHVVARFYDANNSLVRTLDGGYSDHGIGLINFSQNPYDPAQGLLAITDGSWNASFDALSDGGVLLPNGVYRVEVESRDTGVQKILVSSNLTILSGKGHGLDTTGVYPNPVKAGDRVLFITWLPPVPVEVSIYNLAGERVAYLGLLNPPPFATWNLKSASGQDVANGIYVAVLRNKASEILRIVKVVVVK